jgi:nucleoside-diphosphate-sugar epimerase
MDKGVTGQSYILTGPIHTLADAFDIAQQLTGIRAPPIKIPPAVLRVLASMAGPLEKHVSLPPNYTADALRASAGVTYLASSEKARRELGFTARPLRDGLSETLEYEKQKLEVQARKP